MESGIHHTGGVLQTNSDVLWVDQFVSNISSNDEQITKRFDQHRKSGGIYR